MNPEPHPGTNPEGTATPGPAADEHHGAFAALVQNAAQEMRQAISEAEQALTAQLKQAGLDGLLPGGAQGLDAALAPILDDVVAGTFAQAKSILDQAEQTLAAVQTNMHARQEDVQRTYHAQGQALLDQVENASGAAQAALPAPPPIPAVPLPEGIDYLVPTMEPPTAQAPASMNDTLASLLQTIERSSQHE